MLAAHIQGACEPLLAVAVHLDGQRGVKHVAASTLIIKDIGRKCKPLHVDERVKFQGAIAKRKLSRLIFVFCFNGEVMRMKEFIVRYSLDEQQQAQLKKLVERWNAVAELGETTEEGLFQTMMTLGSAHDIEQRFDMFSSSIKKYEG